MSVYALLKEKHDATNEKNIYVYIPDKTVLSKVGLGKFRVPFDVLRETIEKYAFELPILTLTTPWAKSPYTYIHPIVDVDYKTKDQYQDTEGRFKDGQLMMKALNEAQILNLNNWSFSYREAPNSGLHFYHRHVKIATKDYPGFLLMVKNVLDDETWQVDAVIQNISLPYCGKASDPQYVYKDQFKNPDPWLWCDKTTCENACKLINIPSKIRKEAKKQQPADFAVTENVSLQEYVTNLEKYAKNLYTLSVPTKCIEKNALVYAALSPDEKDMDDHYKSAEFVNQYLKRCSVKDGMDACMVEYFLTDTKCILKLHRDKRGIYISDEFYTKFKEAYENGSVNDMCLLLALQFPIYVVDDVVYIYTEQGWVKESTKYIKWLIETILHFAKGQASNSKLPVSIAYLKTFMETYWGFDEKIAQQKRDSKYMPNYVVCTNDYYIFARDSTTFVKATILHPYFINNTCWFSKNQLEEGQKLFKEKFGQILDIFDNVLDVLYGKSSFVELFKDENFLECPLMACIYFLITYFSFDIHALKYFLNLVHQILFGLTKRIILMVGASANNGKTTLSKILNAAFGNLCGVYNESELVRNASMTSPDFVNNAQKKITFLDESGEVKLDVNLLKRITSNGLSSSRTLFRTNEVLKCLTNFIMFGNSKPILHIDQGLKKRIRCFDLHSEFVPKSCSKSEYLSERHKYTANNPHFKKMSFDEEQLGFGFLVLIMYMKPFALDNSDYEMSVFELEDTLTAFIKRHIVEANGESVSTSDLITCLRNFAQQHGADSSYLETRFFNMYSANLTPTGYKNIALKM